MQHNDNGRRAEEAVTQFLIKNGYSLIARNWKTPKCEIDIIAKKDDCVHFVEVKYRSTPNQGSGFEYITAQKLRQMTYAANTWVNAQDWSGPYVLSAASVEGPQFEIFYLESIES